MSCNPRKRQELDFGLFNFQAPFQLFPKVGGLLKWQLTQLHVHRQPANNHISNVRDLSHKVVIYPLYLLAHLNEKAFILFIQEHLKRGRVKESNNHARKTHSFPFETSALSFLQLLQKMNQRETEILPENSVFPVNFHGMHFQLPTQIRKSSTFFRQKNKLPFDVNVKSFYLELLKGEGIA